MLKTYKAGIFYGALIGLALTTGCATIITGKTQEVTIHSTPSGASVSLNGKKLGVTPLTATVNRPEKEPGQLVFEKAGYKTLEIPYAKKMNDWLLGNVLFGGTFGTTTDYSSGAMYEYQPDFLQVNLEAEGMSSLEQKRFSERNEMRHFLLTNYGVLSEEIAVGQGEYLEALATRLDAKENSEFVASLKQRIGNGGAQAFADFVIATYMP